MTPDVAYSNFIQIVDRYSANVELLNEADTRAKIIDSVLKNCLGWSEDFIKRETHNNEGYTDYELIVNDVPVLIIEAKKEGEYFEIPQSKTNRAYKLDGAITTSKNLIAAIEQVRAYCSEVGCKYAAVFNGHQLVVFTAVIIGKSWRDGYCIVYNSLDDIKDNFGQFWNTLSYESVKSGSLVSFIEKGKSKKIFKKLITELHNPDQSWARNELYTYLQPYCDFVFSELLDEARAEVLNECYVYDKSSQPLTREIESYFTDNLPHFAEKYGVSQVLEERMKAGAFHKEFIAKNGELNTGSLMVLLGGIGSGKSTFLHRFFKIVLSKHNNHLWFYVDFRNASPNENEIEDYIFEKMYETWILKYKQEFSGILKSISFQADETNRKEFFKSFFSLGQYLRFSTTITIDNIDQHDLKYQEKIFLTAHHVKDYLKSLTILAIREETFMTSTKTGVLDAYHIQKFHISSPNFLSMIKKRIVFTIKLLNNIDDNVPKDKLIKYLSIINDSLERKNNQSKDIVQFIDSVSVGNMREALRMFNNFIVSGNTNVKEIFSRYEKTGNYQLSYHQFIKSIMLGEYKYYSQDRSHVMNVFDFDNSITDSPFQLLRMLNYLKYRSNKRSRIGNGYVMIDEIISMSESVSIKRDVVIDSLLRLSAFNLVEYDNQSKTNIKTATYVKITSAGNYYLSSLVKEFFYLDSVLIDTPISDTRTLDMLRRDVNSSELERRMSRTKIFVDYLCKCEKDEHLLHPEYLHNELSNVVFFDEISSYVSLRFSEITSKQSSST